MIYDKAILKIYDFPILYFPKFFHPDPSVERQSGFLKPEINNSNILGSSLTMPYFYAKSKEKILHLLHQYLIKIYKCFKLSSEKLEKIII